MCVSQAAPPEMLGELYDQLYTPPSALRLYLLPVFICIVLIILVSCLCCNCFSKRVHLSCIGWQLHLQWFHKIPETKDEFSNPIKIPLDQHNDFRDGHVNEVFQ